MTEPVNLLKPFLFGALPESFELNDGEMLADALVIVRIFDAETGAERLEYTTSRGLSLYTARGMVADVEDQLASVMASMAADGCLAQRTEVDDEDEED